MRPNARQVHGGSRRRRIAAALTPAQWRRAAGLTLFVVALHVAGFGLLLGVVAPDHLASGRRARSASGSASPPTRSACATRSTPTTSARSTTRRAS